MTGQRIEIALSWVIIAVTALFLLAVCGGCAHLDPATKAQVEGVRNEALVAAAKAKAAADAAAAEARNKPASHPIEFANLIIQQVKGPLVFVGSICTLLFFGGIGLWVASFFATVIGGVLAKIAFLVAPVSGCISAGCWLTLALLPWAPWIIAGCIVVTGGVLIYQLARAHWSIFRLFNLHQANLSRIIEVAKAPKTTITLNPAGGPNAPIAG